MKRLFEHLLKLKYWQSELVRNEAHWKSEVLNFRQQIRDELKDSPSLKPYLRQIFDECYQDARQLVAIASNLPLSIFPERLLNRRCGQLLSAQQAQIKSLPIADIENLAEALQYFKRTADLEIWLKN